jgi:hypothetical protein
VAVGPSGDVYVTGRNASSQAFVAKINASGSVLWNQPPSGSSSEGLAVAVDSSENVYLAYVDGGNVAVSKLNPTNGSTVWSGSVGINGNLGGGIAADNAGSVYVTGGGIFLSKSGFFVEKLAPGKNGSLTQSWNEKISGPAWSNGIAIDQADNAYLTGSFRESVNFNPNHGKDVLKSASNWYDVFALKLDTNGN